MTVTVLNSIGVGIAEMVGYDFLAEVGKGIKFRVMKSLPVRPNGQHTVYAFTAGRIRAPKDPKNKWLAEDE
jgi:hypothetical protein